MKKQDFASRVSVEGELSLVSEEGPDPLFYPGRAVGESSMKKTDHLRKNNI